MSFVSVSMLVECLALADRLSDNEDDDHSDYSAIRAIRVISDNRDLIKNLHVRFTRRV